MKINLLCLSFWSFIQKIYKILTFHWSKSMESRRKFPLWNKCFSLVHVSHGYWHPIIATSFSQDNSSEFAWWIWRTPDKRSETIPSSRISPDPSDSQLHVGAAFLQFTPLIFYRVQVRGLGRPWQKLNLVLSDPFLCWFWCLFWIIVLMEALHQTHLVGLLPKIYFLCFIWP